MVAVRPEATCHSMWQWKSQTPGLSERKRRTRWPFGWTRMVSRRIGEAEGVVVLEGSYGPVSEGLRVTTWKAWPWR